MGEICQGIIHYLQSSSRIQSLPSQGPAKYASSSKTIRTESKGKAASRVSSATNELEFLLDFNSSVMAKAKEHLTDFVFVNMANTALLRRDSYLSYLKAGVKADTLNALRPAPLELDTLFPDAIIKQAEEDIAAFDRNRSGSVY